MHEDPSLGLVADPDRRAALRSLAAAESLLTAQAIALADRLEAAGLQPVLQEVPARTTLGGIEEVRLTVTARGEADAILQALDAGAQADLRVFSMRLDPLGGGQAELTAVFVRAASGEDGDAD